MKRKCQPFWTLCSEDSCIFALWGSWSLIIIVLDIFLHHLVILKAFSFENLFFQNKEKFLHIFLLEVRIFRLLFMFQIFHILSHIFNFFTYFSLIPHFMLSYIFLLLFNSSSNKKISIMCFSQPFLNIFNVAMVT